MSVNPELLKMARNNVKQAFVAAGDPAMGAAPADPAMAGGAPPMDPAMAGGAPPMDPAMAGGGDPMAALQPMIDQSVQAAMAANGGGAGGGAGGGKAPKIDVGAELKDLRQQLAKIMDVMGITMTPSEVYGEQEQQQAPAPEAAPAADPSGGALGAINPIQPMKAAQQDEWEQGEAFQADGLEEIEKASQSISELATAMLAVDKFDPSGLEGKITNVSR